MHGFVLRVSAGQKFYCLRLLSPREGRDQVQNTTRKANVGTSTEREGVKAAIRYLRAQGYDPKDMGTQKVGHDIRLGKRRIEVKASEKDRAWMEVDIRSACNVTVNGQQNRAVAKRNGLNIDGIVEVTRIGKSGGPVVYFYPRSLVEKYGLLGVKTLWIVRVPEEVREKYQLNLKERGRRT